MAKLFERKWRIAAIAGFVVALACDWRAKGFAASAMRSIAQRGTGLQTQEQLKSLGRSSDTWQCIGLAIALVAVVFCGIAVKRREPGSLAWVLLLAMIYGLSFFIMI